MDSHQILHICCSARGTPYVLRILRSIKKSKCYSHFKGIKVGPKQSSTSYFHSICLKLTILIDHHTETIYIKYHTTLCSKFFNNTSAILNSTCDIISPQTHILAFSTRLNTGGNLMMNWVHLCGHLKILNTVIERRSFDLYLSVKKRIFSILTQGRL